MCEHTVERLLGLRSLFLNLVRLTDTFGSSLSFARRFGKIISEKEEAIKQGNAKKSHSVQAKLLLPSYSVFTARIVRSITLHAGSSRSFLLMVL